MSRHIGGTFPRRVGPRYLDPHSGHWRLGHGDLKIHDPDDVTRFVWVREGPVPSDRPPTASEWVGVLGEEVSEVVHEDPALDGVGPRDMGPRRGSWAGRGRTRGARVPPTLLGLAL